MIYWISYSKIMPGTPEGMISGLLEDVFTDSVKAEKTFKDLKLTPEYFRKELWVKEPGGRKRMIKYEKYNGT